MLRKIEADRGAVGIAEVESSLMEKRRRPGAIAEALVAGEFQKTIGGGFGDDENAVLGENDELSVRDNQGAAEVGLRPNGLAGFGVETAEMGFDFFLMNGAVEAKEVAFVEDGRVDVVLEFLVGPDGVG